VADCSVYGSGQLVRPWHPYTRASQTPLTPGTPTQLQIEIFPTTAVIEPGHALRLTISTGDFPHETSTLSTTLGAAGIDTLYLGPDHPSLIYLGTVSPAPASRSVRRRSAAAVAPVLDDAIHVQGHHGRPRRRL
jgi:predicted acyl esterase